MKLKVMALSLLSASALASTAMAGEITVFDWSGYDDAGFFEAYVEKHGEAPDFSFFADDEEGFNKLRAGFSADLAHPCLNTMPKFRAAGLIKPIDTSRISAWDKLLPALTQLSDFVDEDGTVWALPFDWGNTGMVYRTDKIDQAQATLQLFADPSMTGRVSLPDGVADAYALAALAIGITDWRAMTDEQFEQASDFLRLVHPNVRFYWSDQGQLDAAIKSGEVDIAWAWSATELALVGEEVPVTMVRDGSIGVASWACGYVHLKSGEGSDEAVYDYLNAISDVAAGKYIIEAWGYAHSNTEAYTAADQETVNAYGYGDVEGFLSESLFTVSVPQELDAKMVKEFERIKAGF
ncbi:ABC transporter substrate-binding protein [Parasedimentitalea psychrophila]|nr:extracellular solute-binding protein [Parasedimentitalea psychrophila]